MDHSRFEAWCLCESDYRNSKLFRGIVSWLFLTLATRKIPPLHRLLSGIVPMTILRWLDSFSRLLFKTTLLTPLTISIAPRLASTVLSFTVDWCTLHVCQVMAMDQATQRRVALCVASAWVVLAMYFRKHTQLIPYIVN